MSLAFIEELLENTKSAFLKEFNEQLKAPTPTCKFDFDSKFKKILGKCEMKSQDSKRQRTFNESKKFQNTLAAMKSQNPSNSSFMSKDSFGNEADDERTSNDESKSLKMSPNEVNKTKQKFLGKSKRQWDDKISKQDAVSLDYSDKDKSNSEIETSNSVRGDLLLKSTKSSADMLDLSDGESPMPESSSSEDESPKKASKLGSFLSGLVGTKPLEEADILPFQQKMKLHLASKNVASEIADSITNAVGKSLLGQKPGAFTTIYRLVNERLEVALRQILTPRSSIEILNDIRKSNSAGKVFSIAFIGVNGVGKSTNLSKVCFWLLKNQFKILIAACDTFRSGAVEQLKTHVRNLKTLDGECRLELYEKGYGKDAANIAKDAISYAKKNMFDVVLIDTAGRMQDNEPLMRSLANLVKVNQPDKIIFVGEALVGNEAFDQLSKFNAALKDYSDATNPRQIDGIILSKFDTVDDKVGAALSMTYISKAPIYFIGTGQTYTDLKKMNVKSIVTTLLK